MKQKNGLINLISGDEALQAINIVGKMADENNVAWAVCGGIAMAIYGSPRLTKDIDIIASNRLPLKKKTNHRTFTTRRRTFYGRNRNTRSSD
jgi:hypothetical protein